MGDGQEEPALLALSPYDAGVLRVQAQDVAFPLSVGDRSLIRSMIFSLEPEQLRRAGAPWPSAAGMAAPQWGHSKRIFLWARQYLETSSQPDLAKTVCGSPNFAVALNPEYKADAGTACIVVDEQVDGWEGCFSVPGMRGQVRRFARIEASFTCMDGVRHIISLEGWAARVFQHECDHTEGRLYDDEAAGRCSCKLTSSEYERTMAGAV